MNTKQVYKRNHRGISISMDQGQINVAKKVMKYLGDPEEITFLRCKRERDWMYILPGRWDDPFAAGTGTIHYRNKAKRSGAYISSVQLVRNIFRIFHIMRYNTKCFSPFYFVRETEYKGVSCLMVCMDHFEKYYTT